MKKKTLGIFYGKTCSGCDVQLLDLGEKFVKLLEYYDLVFWSLAVDTKFDELDKIERIDVAIIHGSIRTDEQKERLKYVREKSDVLVAFGTCACYGGIIGLANLLFKDDVLKIVYAQAPSTVNPEHVVPSPITPINDAKLKLPALEPWVQPLSAFVHVEVFVPGCPPPVNSIEELATFLINYAKTGEKPTRSIIIAEEKSLCDVCPRNPKASRKIIIPKFRRLHEVKIDENKCFLEQGIICLGPVTRAGCDARCIKANVPCRGCMGPAPNVIDMASKFITSIASLVEIDKERMYSDEELIKKLEEIPDPAGYFSRFTLPSGLIKHRVKKG